MQRIVINGNVYSNVSSITPNVEYSYYHDIEALDGTVYQKVRYTKTNYTVVFFNMLDGAYINLRDLIKRSKGVPIEVGIPNDNDGYDYAMYYIRITEERLKGYLMTGNQYKTGLVLELKRVAADE